MISMIARLAPMLWKLKRSKKPWPVREKKTTRASRNSQAQNWPRSCSARRSGRSASSPGPAASATASEAAGGLVQRETRGGEGSAPLADVARCPSFPRAMICLLLALVDCGLGFGRVHVGAVDHHVASGHALLDAARVALDRIDRVLHTGAAHVGRFLGADQVDHVIPQVLDPLLWRVEVGDLHRSGQVRVLDRLRRALGAEQVRPEDPGQVRGALEQRRGLLSRLRGAVVVVVHAYQRHRAPRGLDRLLAPLLALVRGADTRLDVLDVELPLAADRLDERVTGDLATLDVVRADVRQREGDRALLVVAVADVGVDGDHLDAGVV